MKATPHITCLTVAVLLLSAVLARAKEAELREWTFKNGDTVTLRLENAYGATAYFSDKKGKPANAPIALFTESDQADIVYWSRQRDRVVNGDSPTPSRFTMQFRKDARAFRNGRLVKEDWTDKPEPEFYAIYTSASWCAPCRRFTPSLVQSYDFLKPMYGDRFELVLCSWDETEPAMLGYMKDEGMKWYGNWMERKSKFWRKYQGDGIPCLVLVDREGYVLSHSYTSKEYVGPGNALSDLTKLLVYTSTDKSSRVSVPPPGIDFGKLKVAIEKRQKEAQTTSKELSVQIVHSPQRLLRSVVDPEGIEAEIKLKITVSELGVAKNVSVVGNDNPELNLQIYRALLLWQFLPAVGNDGTVRSSDIVLPIRLKLKEAYLASVES